MSGSSRKCQGREGRVARGKSGGIGSKTKNWFAVSTYIHSTVTAVAILDRVMVLRDPFSIKIFVR